MARSGVCVPIVEQVGIEPAFSPVFQRWATTPRCPIQQCVISPGRNYSKPVVYHLIRHLCPFVLVNTATGGSCGGLSQGSQAATRYAINIAGYLISFLWGQPDSNRHWAILYGWIPTSFLPRITAGALLRRAGLFPAVELKEGTHSRPL